MDTTTNRARIVSSSLMTSTIALILSSVSELNVTLGIMALIVCAWYYEWPGWRPRGPMR